MNMVRISYILMLMVKNLDRINAFAEDTRRVAFIFYHLSFQNVARIEGWKV